MMLHGPIPSGYYICHVCDTPGCVRPEHLFIGTQRDNMADCKAKGRTRSPRGEAHHKAKLTSVDIREIRKARGHEIQINTAARFGIRQNNVSHIQRRETWRHVEEEDDS